MAAFTPFVVLRLLPVLETAVVAQGVSRSPARAAQSGTQGAYYVQGLQRMAGGSRPPARTAPTLTAMAGASPSATSATAGRTTNGRTADALPGRSNPAGPFIAGSRQSNPRPRSRS